MADMTLAEKIARTVELDNELRAIWGHGRVATQVHDQTHTDVHEGTSITAIASLSGGSWIVASDIGAQFHSPRMFAPADTECSTCRALIAEAAIYQERREVNHVGI